MSEYWKSLPKKFCDACKCWFADNKASIDFHEKGKRHRENVQKRLNTLMRKGQKEYEANRKYEMAMNKIEKEAMKAFAKDVVNNPALATQYSEMKTAKQKKSVDVQALRPSSDISSRVSRTKEMPTVCLPEQKAKRWCEAKAEDDATYYWNSETGESQWEAPKEFISLAEQEKIAIARANSDIPISSYGPTPLSQPYGQWMPVMKKKEKVMDLQLPACSEESTSATIVAAPEETQRKFKIKTVGSLSEKYGSSSNETTVFKKRKNTEAGKRNIRRRDDD